MLSSPLLFIKSTVRRRLMWTMRPGRDRGGREGEGSHCAKLKIYLPYRSRTHVATRPRIKTEAEEARSRVKSETGDLYGDDYNSIILKARRTITKTSAHARASQASLRLHRFISGVLSAPSSSTTEPRNCHVRKLDAAVKEECRLFAR